ncbi:hypothetical protein QQP08_025717 [Theobroma cacao]|nr:hypothetical protein QQP08_025717 [Theobroma cacao]
MSGRSHESYWPAFSHFYNPMACKSMGDPEACHDGIISFLWNWLVGLIKCRWNKCEPSVVGVILDKTRKHVCWMLEAHISD